MSVSQERSDAYDAGWRDAVRLYAVWRDGKQLVGVMEHPLEEVLEKGPPVDTKRVAMEGADNADS